MLAAAAAAAVSAASEDSGAENPVPNSSLGVTAEDDAATGACCWNVAPSVAAAKALSAFSVNADGSAATAGEAEGVAAGAKDGAVAGAKVGWSPQSLSPVAAKAPAAFELVPAGVPMGTEKLPPTCNPSLVTTLRMRACVTFAAVPEAEVPAAAAAAAPLPSSGWLPKGFLLPRGGKGVTGTVKADTGTSVAYVFGASDTDVFGAWVASAPRWSKSLRAMSSLSRRNTK